MSIMPQLAALRRHNILADAIMVRAQSSVPLLPDNCFCDNSADEDDIPPELRPKYARKDTKGKFAKGAASAERIAQLESRYVGRLAEYGLTLADMASENPTPDIRQRIAQLNREASPIVENEDYRPVERLAVYVPRVYSQSATYSENAE